MKSLIIDCFQHYPSLYYIIDAKYCVLVPKYSNEKFFEKYNFNYDTTIVYDKYICVFIVMPLLNISSLHEPVRWKYFYDMLCDNINKLRNNKIVIIDNHDYDILPDKDILSTIDYDIILKRNFSREINYYDIITGNNNINKKIYPFPYVDCNSNIDPMYLIMSYKCDVKSELCINRVFWIGSEYNHVDKVYGRENDRHKILSSIRGSLYTPTNKLEHGVFMSEISKSKYALSLAGCSSWGTRHFEIMAAGALMLFQIDGCTPPPKNHVFPFPLEFNVNCQFTSGEDFKMKLKKMQEDENLYLECLKRQNEILKEYFSMEFIKNYIEEIILN